MTKQEFELARSKTKLKIIDTCKDRDFFLFSTESLSVAILNSVTSKTFIEAGFEVITEEEFRAFIKEGEEKNLIDPGSFVEIFFPDTESARCSERIAEFRDFCKLFNKKLDKPDSYMTFSEYMPVTDYED